MTYRIVAYEKGVAMAMAFVHAADASEALGKGRALPMAEGRLLAASDPDVPLASRERQQLERAMEREAVSNG